MKKIMLLIFNIFTISSSVYGDTINERKCGQKYEEMFNNEKIEVLTICYESGDWDIKRKYKGKLHGVYQSFYSNGAKKKVALYLYGKNEGIKEGWLPDGFLAVYQTYHNGIPVDTHKVWYDNKKQESIIIYDSTGEKNGWCRNWYENGNLKDSTLFTHGDKLQEFLFYENGKSMFTSTLKKDGYIISARSWFPDGKQNGEIKNGNGKVITPRSIPNAYDTLVVKDGKVQNSSFYMFHDQ